MAEAALIAKFGGKKRPAPKFGDEGPPSSEVSGRGSGSGTGEEDSSPTEPDMDDAGGSGGDGVGMSADPEEQAVDDLADIVGVGPEDRDDFAAALKSYVSACIASSMAPPDMPGGMAADGGGPP